MADPRDKALQDYRKKLLEHKEIDGRLKEREWRPGGKAVGCVRALSGVPAPPRREAARASSWARPRGRRPTEGSGRGWASGPRAGPVPCGRLRGESVGERRLRADLGAAVGARRGVVNGEMAV